MNKIKIAIASAFMFAVVFGASAQSALQQEIQKVKAATEEAAGTVSKDARNDAKKIKGELKKDLKKGECKMECKKGELKCEGRKAAMKDGSCKKRECANKGDFKKGIKEEAKMGKGRKGAPMAMFNDLNLTADQQKQIEALYAKRQEKAKAAKEEIKAQKQAKADKKKADREEFNAELQKILTPEQYKTFTENRASKMKGMNKDKKEKMTKGKKEGKFQKGKKSDRKKD